MLQIPRYMYIFFLPALRKHKERLQRASGKLCVFAPPSVNSCKGFSVATSAWYRVCNLKGEFVCVRACFHSEVMTRRQETLLSNRLAAQKKVCSPLTVSSASKEVKHRWSDESFEPHQHMNDS